MTRSPSPSNALTAPVAVTSFFNDDGDDGVVQIEGEPGDVAVAVVVDVTMEVLVAADVTMTVTVSVVLGDVDPDVRLLITSPASIKNGAELPLELIRQVLLNGSMLLQQNIDSLLTRTRYIPAPLPVPTVIQMSA